MRSAHGLAGSIIRLFDTLEIGVIREIRVPLGLDIDSLQELSMSIGTSTAIQENMVRLLATGSYSNPMRRNVVLRSCRLSIQRLRSERSLALSSLAAMMSRRTKIIYLGIQDATCSNSLSR